MKLRAITAAAALASAIALTGPVAAQDFMLRGESIPVDQVDNIKEACEGLRAANAASLTTNDDQSVDPTETGSTSADDSLQASSSDPAAQDKWEELMATLTFDECDEAGFFVE